MFITETYSARDVFTPTKPARYTFVEREQINNKLVPALRTPGKQIVVYGHSGSGKTTLLVNKLHQVYEAHITTRCMSSLTFDQLLLDAFDQLAAFFDSERVVTRKKNISSSLETEYLGIKTKIGVDRSTDHTIKQQRVLPPQLTPQTLARFLGEARCCWVLEDFHKIEPAEKKRLAQVMKVFMDMSDHYSDLKIIAIGAVGTARQVIEYDPEMRNRVSEILVPLMSDEELRSIPEKGARFLNINIQDNVKDELVKYSNGLASVCHQLCLNMCFASGVELTTNNPIDFDNNLFKQAIDQYLEEASDTLKSAFEKALRQEHTTKFDDVNLVIEALLQVDQDGATRPAILTKIKEKENRYPLKQLSNTLDRLQTEEGGGIISYDKTSGRYSFSDPFYRSFALALMEKKIPKFDVGPIFVVTSFDDSWGRLFSSKLTLDAPPFFDVDPTLRSYEPKDKDTTAHKMDWQDKFFTGKRKGRHPRRRK
jgi:hypothetical protein